MNDRIKQLAEQSNLMDYMVQLYTINAPNGYRQPLDVRMAAMEKFAELIVRECAGIAYEYDIPNLTGPGEFIGNRMKKHFGVEE